LSKGIRQLGHKSLGSTDGGCDWADRWATPPEFKPRLLPLKLPANGRWPLRRKPDEVADDERWK
jgi:hypothetical protein